MINPKYILLLNDYNMRDNLSLILFALALLFVGSYYLYRFIVKKLSNKWAGIISVSFYGSYVILEIVLIILAGFASKGIAP